VLLDVDAQQPGDPNGRTVLADAVSTANAELVKILVAHGANVKATALSNIGRRTLLHIDAAATCFRQGRSHGIDEYADEPLAR
jgi:hypothetical protein